MMTTVAVQQRQRLFREGIGQLVDAEQDLQLVGTAGTPTDLLALCEGERPDVALLEADTPEWDVARLSRSLRRAVSGLRLVGLSAGDMSPAELTKARRSGIKDVVPRSAGIAQILAALRPANPSSRRPRPTGRSAMTPRGDTQSGTVLTSRELTILNFVGAGFTSREISAQLAISHKTVENHKQRIFGKLGVQNQAHAVSVAMRRGLMRPERVIGLSVAD